MPTEECDQRSMALEGLADCSLERADDRCGVTFRALDGPSGGVMHDGVFCSDNRTGLRALSLGLQLLGLWASGKSGRLTKGHYLADCRVILELVKVRFDIGRLAACANKDPASEADLNHIDDLLFGKVVQLVTG